MGKKCFKPEDSCYDSNSVMPGPGAYTSKLMTIGHSGPHFNL